MEDQSISKNDKGPTEELQEMAKPERERLTPGVETPGAQDPDSPEIKDEINPNTE